MVVCVHTVLIQFPQSQIFGQNVKLCVLCMENSVPPVVFVKLVLYVYPYASSLVPEAFPAIT